MKEVRSRQGVFLEMSKFWKHTFVGLFFLILTVALAAAFSYACVSLPVAAVPLGAIGASLGAYCATRTTSELTAAFDVVFAGRDHEL